MSVDGGAGQGGDAAAISQERGQEGQGDHGQGGQVWASIRFESQ
jgi:hypothetical protein